MDRLIKKLYCLKDYDCNADLLEIMGTFKKWKAIKTTAELDSVIDAMTSVVVYFSEIRNERDALHAIIEELREDKNHYALRAREAEHELKMLRDKQDPLQKLTK